MKIFLSHKGVSFVTYLIFCITAVVFLNSCTDNSDIPVNTPGFVEGEAVNVRFRISASDNPVTRVNTRNQTADETKINDVWVLVFVDNNFSYKVKGQITSSDESYTSFDAKLQTSRSPVTLWLIANTGNLIDDKNFAGTNPEQVKMQINLDYVSESISGNIPMYGEHRLPGGLNLNNMSTIDDVQMLRAVSRVDVILGPEVNNFELTSVRVYNVNNNIQVIPNALVNVSYPLVDAPSVPSGAGIINLDQVNITGNTLVSNLYLPESSGTNITNITNHEGVRLVIGGNYTAGNTITQCYYRIDIPSGDKVGELLRNHRYVIRIDNVSGPGGDIQDDVAINLSSNISTSIEKWEDNQSGYVSNGSEHFRFSSSHLRVGFRKGQTASIEINSKLKSPYVIQWTDANGSPLVGQNSGTEIENNWFTAKILQLEQEDDSRIEITAKSDNKDFEVRPAYVTILADDWKIRIYLEQINAKEYALVNVNILSAGTSFGSFGGTLTGRINDGNSKGFRELLLNTDNFGPNGIVPLNLISFDYATSAQIGNNQNYREMFDIINITYGGNPTTSQAESIKSWLEASKHRVLIISTDNSNTNLFNQFYESYSSLISGRASETFYFMGTTTDNEYFTTSGPFGAVNPGKDSFSFTAYSAVWRGMPENMVTQYGLTPLLYSTDRGYILTVDKERRIIFMAQSGISIDYDGALDGSGVVNDDRSRLIANLYAWIIEEIVIPGKVQYLLNE